MGNIRVPHYLWMFSMILCAPSSSVGAFILPKNSGIIRSNDNIYNDIHLMKIRHRNSSSMINMRSNEERDGVNSEPSPPKKPPRQRQQQQQPLEPPPPRRMTHRRQPLPSEKQQLVYDSLEGLDLYEAQKQDTRYRTQNEVFDPMMVQAQQNYQDDYDYMMYTEPLVVDEDLLEEERRLKQLEKDRRIAQMAARMREEEAEDERRRAKLKKEIAADLEEEEGDINKTGSNLELKIRQLKDELTQMQKKQHTEKEGDDDDKPSPSPSTTSSLEFEVDQLKNEILELKKQQSTILDILDSVVGMMATTSSSSSQYNEATTGEFKRGDEPKKKNLSNDDDEETFVIGSITL